MPVPDSDVLAIDNHFSTTPTIHPPRAVTRMAFAACLVLGQSMFIAGCGGDSTATIAPPVAPAAAPAISGQPVAQSIPMGLPAAYTVTATGSALQYQWKKNGVSIGGATDSSYTTPATAFADSGASFSVTVSNSGGTVDSTAAALTVTARAPMAGDLRFQQVDAPSTVYGWGTGTGVGTDLLPRSAMSYSQSIGTPFYVGAGNCAATPAADGVGCDWSYSEYPAAAHAGSASISANYATDSYANFQADLQSTTWPDLQLGAATLTPASAGSVITSLDLEPASGLFALSWVQSTPASNASAQSWDQSTQASAFLANQNTVAPANLQATATLEGAAGRVITALSYDAGQITCLSYGWQSDVGTVYESQVVTSSTSNAPTAATNLAAQGYIITASGRADDAGNVLLVGTRVQGDTMARPFMSGQGAVTMTAMQQGYSIVAVIFDLTQTNSTTFILER